MAARTALYRLVNGTGLIKVGTGASNALEDLGVPMDGATVEITEFENPVYNDVGGPETPVDYQYMGQLATIRVTIIDIVDSVQRKIRNRPFTNPAASAVTPTDGESLPRGLMYGLGARAFKLSIASEWEDPWYFPTVKVARQPISFKLGTVVTAWQYTFQAWPYIAPTVTGLASTASGSLPILYARVIP